MSSSAEKIKLIKDIFDDIASAIIEKGIDVGECESPATYAEKIRQIQTCDHQEPDQPVLPAGIVCDYTSMISGPEGGTRNITVSYLRYKAIHEPSISYVSGNNWLQISTVSSGDNSVYKLTIAENTLTTNRVAKITFACEDDSTIATHVITLTQKAFVEEINPVSVMCLSGSSIEVPSEGSDFNVSVQYKNATTINTPSITSDWITLNNTEENVQDENTTVVNYTFSASKNETADRSKVLMFSARGKENSTDSANVTVSQKKVVTPDSVITYDLQIEPNSAEVNVGDITSFVIKCTTYSDGVVISENEVVTSLATWTSSDYSIASVTRGDVTGKKVGSVTITAAYNGKTVIATVKVNPKPVEPICKVTLDPTSIILDYHAGYEATAYATFENATPHSVVSNEYCKIEYVEEEATNVHEYKFTSLQNGKTSDINTNVQIKYTNTLTGNVETITVPVTINKLPGATLNVNPTSVTFTYGGGIKTAKVTTTNTETYFVAKEDLDWLDATIDGMTIKLTADLNESTASRNGRVIVSCIGPDDVEKQAWIEVVQEGKPVISEPKPMYYGYIPYIKGVSPTGYDKITGDYILQCVEDGTIKKIDKATTMGKTSFGVVPKYSLLLIAVPSDSGLVGKMDDGDGAKVNFASATPNSNGENTININGIAYSLYGQYAPFDLPNESTFFYIIK